MAASRSTPSHPFAGWPVQLVVPGVGFYWYAGPVALACQLTVEHVTAGTVDAHNDVLDALLAERGAEIGAAGGLLIFNDWRSIQSLAPGSRSRQQARMNARGTVYARRTVVVVSPGNRLLRMAVEAASLFTTLFMHSRIELATSTDVAFAQAALTPPLRGIAFPGRPAA